MFDADKASRSIGMQLLAAGDSTAAVQLTIGADMVNGHAIAHGGDTCSCSRTPRSPAPATAGAR